MAGLIPPAAGRRARRGQAGAGAAEALPGPASRFRVARVPLARAFAISCADSGNARGGWICTVPWYALLRLRGEPLAGMAIRGPGPDLHKRARGSEKVPGSPDPRSCRSSVHAVRDLLTSPTYRIRPNAAGGSCSGRHYRIPVVLLLRQHRPDAARHPVRESDLRLLRRHRRPLLRGVEQAYRPALANNVPRHQGVGKRLSAAGPFGVPASDTTADRAGHIVRRAL
jgi:hypothetical protein